MDSSRNGRGKITPKQTLVYEFLKQEIREKGFPPSIREICAAVGLKSTSSVHAHLETLEAKGYIRRLPNKNRTIEILEPDFYQSSFDVVNIPIIGKVTAGEPILAVENIEDTYPVPAGFIIGGHESFMLRIQGNSMIEKGIFNNDLVLVSKQETAENGDIVVALIEDSATVKTFYREKNTIRLQPANPEYEPIYTESASIVGKVVGLFRQY